MKTALTAIAAVSMTAGFAYAVPGDEDPCALMIVDSGLDRVVLLDSEDGSVLNTNWIDIAAAAASDGYTGGLTPKEAIVVGTEVWVSDQVADRIWRFDTVTQSYLGSIGGDTGDLNNIRGMHQFGNTVYVAMGSDSDNFDEGIITIDAMTGAITGQFNGRDPADTSYFDVNFYNGNLLVSNSDTGNDGLEIYSIDGSYLGNLVTSDGETGIDFAQQINRTEDGNLLVGGFSTPSGVYMYDMFGNDLGIVAGADAGTRAGYELGNGEIIWTNGSFIATDGETILEGGSYQYITKVQGDFVPAPSAMALLGLGGLIAGRRRR
ncbi:MAG: PEP-CTERM sorting domain-containing protein [Planctomycetota bacterium]